LHFFGGAAAGFRTPNQQIMSAGLCLKIAFYSDERFTGLSQKDYPLILD
jgi:hypothetical protein